MVKLSLGTAQFGMDYGITNTKGQVNLGDIELILRSSIESDVNFIDTAQSYGESEAILGNFSSILKHFKVSTKLSCPRNVEINKVSVIQFRDSVFCSLDNLGIGAIDSLLIHDISILEKSNIFLLLEMLYKLKSDGYINRLGLSLYSPDELIGLDFDLFTLLQVPTSIYNQSFVRSPLFRALPFNKISIHLRSIFLQGIILQNHLPKTFSKDFKTHHQNTLSYCERNNISNMRLSLAYIKSLDHVEAALIGVSSFNEFHEIIKVWDDINSNTLMSINFSDFAWSSSKEVDPRYW